jgi:hypothetical protein
MVFTSEHKRFILLSIRENGHIRQHDLFGTELVTAI